MIMMLWLLGLSCKTNKVKLILPAPKGAGFLWAPRAVNWLSFSFSYMRPLTRPIQGFFEKCFRAQVNGEIREIHRFPRDPTANTVDYAIREVPLTNTLSGRTTQPTRPTKWTYLCVGPHLWPLHGIPRSPRSPRQLAYVLVSVPNFFGLVGH